MAVILLLVLLALWYECVELFLVKSDEVDMRLFELVRLQWLRLRWRLSLRLSERLEAVVVLARFNRNLRIRKMSDSELWPWVEPPWLPDLLELPDEVVRSLGFPTSRVPIKQCVSAILDGQSRGCKPHLQKIKILLHTTFQNNGILGVIFCVKDWFFGFKSDFLVF